MTKKTETADLTLEALPKQINERLKKADKHLADARDMRISAGALLVDAKAKVLARKADGEEITWKGWVEQNIERSYRDCNKCIALLNAPDPAKAAQDERNKAKEGMAKTREKANGKASDIDPTEGMPTEEKNPDEGQTLDPKKEESPEEAVQEVDDILTDAEKLEDLRLKIAYWVSNTATAEELRDLESYMSIPDIPKGTKLAKTIGGEVYPEDKQRKLADEAAKKVVEKAAEAKAKPEVDEIVVSEGDHCKLGTKPKTAEESLKAAAEKVKNGKTPKIEDALKDEGDDDYVRPGLEGADLSKDAGGEMPDFLKRG